MRKETGISILILFLLFTVFMESGLNSKSIWRDKNIYSSADNLKVGDIVVLNVNDVSGLRFNLSLRDRSSSDIATNPDVTITGFLPKISSSRNINNNDSTQFSGKGELKISVPSRIVNRNARGILNVAGTRTYTFNGVVSRVTVSGLVDPVLLKGRNIDSKNVADFRIEIRGSKQGTGIRRAALKEGESASTGLTEQEKQKIITDYLEKMLNEITR